MQLPEHVDGTLFRTPNELCNLIKDEIPADHKGRCIGGCWLLAAGAGAAGAGAGAGTGGGGGDFGDGGGGSVTSTA